MQQLTDCDFDIVIVGSGIVGTALALALARQSWRVAVIEAKANLPQDKRSLALSLASLNILDELNLLSALDPHLQAIEVIQVSSAGQFAKTHFVAKDYGFAAFGQTIAAQALNRIMREQLLAQSQITWLCPASLQNLQAAAGGYRLSVLLEGREEFYRCRLLVGADGSNSQVRKLANIALKSHDYRQQGIVAQVQLARDHQHIAYERFMAEGAIAALPLPECKVGIVWSLATSQALDIIKLTDSEFLQSLQAAWGYRLGRLIGVKNRQSFPLKGLYATEQIRAGLVLLGNSAHSLHPIAAQGLNLSLRDMAVLAEQLRQAQQMGQNPGSLNVLQRYLALRKTDQQQTLAFTQGIKALFSSELLPIRVAKNLVLNALNISPATKKLLAMQGMGFSSYLRS